jgi:hypothetical protein
LLSVASALTFAAGVACVLTFAAGADATILSPWGSDLSATPSLDTANGDTSDTGSTVGAARAIAPNPHEAEDLGVWNAAASAGATARQGGQVLEVKIEGCSVKDKTAPSQDSAGTPVNTIEFQTLAPRGRDWTATATAGRFLLPFCGSAGSAGTTVSPGYVSTYRPLHECISRGDAVAFHNIGGFIPSQGKRGPWYPQGVPMEVIAVAASSKLDSFVGVATSTYGPRIWGPNDKTRAERGRSGWGTEAGEELMLQIIEGAGDDAYGVCPGGLANEASNSNAVKCVDSANPEPGQRSCPGFKKKRER